ncbi:MAG: hypothetical protein FWC00_02300, partial [Firmicutes bacterium]|nr:hypothetical protein [Bacillota bacterium]
MKNSHKLVLALVLSLGIAIACKDMNPEISGGVGTPPTSPKPTEQGGPPVPDQILVPEQEGAVYGIPSGTPFFVDNMWDDMGNIDAIIQQMKINLFHISKSFGIGLAELNDYLEAERARLIDNITRKNNNLGFVSVQHLENDAVARFLLHFGIDPTSVWWMEDHQRGFVNKKFARNGVPVSPMDVVPDDDWNHDDWNSYVPQLSGQEQQRIDSMSRQELIQATQEMGTCSWHYALSRRLDELDAMSARVEGRDPIDMPEPLEPAWPEHETHNGG